MTAASFHHSDIADRLSSIEQRLDGLERMIAATQDSVAQAVEVLCAASDRDGTSIRNLSERITHENLAILDLLGEMRDKLDPAYARIFPEFARFTDEVEEILKRRPKS